MYGASPARRYATLVGGGLAILGILGFFYEASFDTGGSLDAEQQFGTLAANGWRNVLYVALGSLGLAMAGSRAREYALSIGALLVLLAVLGFVELGSGDVDDTILQAIPVDTEGNVLHLLLGALGIGAGLATRDEEMPPPAIA